MTINGWQLIERIGAGGMGEVWRAQHAHLGTGALKLLRAELLADRDALSRFRREARTLQRIAGQCTGRVLDVEVDGSTPYIVTEYVAGPTLRAYVGRNGPIAADDVLEAFGLGLAEALTAVHAAGVVHRDLTANNVLMGSDGPKVVDFGIARYVDANQVTTTAFSIGTPGWMSPEQIRGGDVGPPSDMFCWALLVCFAASGRNVFGLGSADALLYRIVHEQPSLPLLPPSIAPAVIKALAKDPELRPTAVEVQHALELSVGTSAASFLRQAWRQQTFGAQQPRAGTTIAGVGPRPRMRGWVRSRSGPLR